jgi:predicted SAM-dependent methyltransferase
MTSIPKHVRFLELGPAKTKHTKNRARFSKLWFTAGIARKGKVDLVQDLECPWALPNARFDAVFASHVLEHIEKPLHFMTECHRVLKTGGLLRISVPNVAVYMERYLSYKINLARFLRCINDDKPRGHKQAFDPGTLKALFSKAGFRNVFQRDPMESGFMIMHVEYFSNRPEVSIFMEGVK